MHLPYADEFTVEIATDAIANSTAYYLVDSFLTGCAMNWDSDYEGEHDFGTLTRIDLDDELRVILTLLDHIAVCSWDRDYVPEMRPDHYAAFDVMLGAGSDQRWMADWSAHTTDDAVSHWNGFADAYSQWLGCEDCGQDPCVCGDEPEPTHIPGGLLDELRQAERMLGDE